MNSYTLNKLIRAARMGYIIIAVILCIMGILIILHPNTSFLILCIAAGVLLIIFGIVKLLGYLSRDLYRLAFQYDLAFGILLITLGIIMLCHPQGILTFFFSVTGILLLADALFKIQLCIDAKAFGIRRWWLILLLAVMTGVFGVLLILKPTESAALIATLLGLAIFLEGILNLATVLLAVKVSKMNAYNHIESEIIESNIIE